MVRRVVLDTNILVSGLLWEGNEAEVIRLARGGSIIALTSPNLLFEFAGVLGHSHIKRIRDSRGTSAKELMKSVGEFSRLIIPSISVGIIKEDPKDNRVIECALESKADYIVTGDSHLLKLRDYKGIRIMTAKEFLEH